jgi:hypothetical protein
VQQTVDDERESADLVDAIQYLDWQILNTRNGRALKALEELRHHYLTQLMSESWNKHYPYTA